MPSVKINFFSEDTVFIPREKSKIRSWVKHVIEAENKKLSELNFIFCSDNYLLKINQDYLKHDTYTDIITFNTSDDPSLINGDIFISIDRVRENALKFQVKEKDELHRVIIHGTLHLLGFKDKTKQDKGLMTGKENLYMAVRNF